MGASQVKSGHMTIQAGDVHWNDLRVAGADDWNLPMPSWFRVTLSAAPRPSTVYRHRQAPQGQRQHRSGRQVQ